MYFLDLLLALATFFFILLNTFRYLITGNFMQELQKTTTVYIYSFKIEVPRVLGVACMSPSEMGEGLVRAGIILYRKSMYFLPGLSKQRIKIQHVD